MNRYIFADNRCAGRADVELGQLRQTIEQLQEEKAKESGRAEKLVEELKGEYSMVKITVGVISLLDGTL